MKLKCFPKLRRETLYLFLLWFYMTGSTLLSHNLKQGIVVKYVCKIDFRAD